ncbi:MAG TPA: hypothetical protein VEV17_07010 [Bryobacteraceae bacterium]|nr:hypothetical protein [Bryobacteraceae bacterium]
MRLVSQLWSVVRTLLRSPGCALTWAGVLALAVSVILMIAPAALVVPLRRATSVDCTVALREE